MRWLYAGLLALNLFVSGAALYVSYVTYQNVNMVGAILWNIINSHSEGQSG